MFIHQPFFIPYFSTSEDGINENQPMIKYKVFKDISEFYAENEPNAMQA